MQAVRAFGLEFQPTVIWNSVDRTKWNPTQWSDVRKRLAKDGEVILALPRRHSTPRLV